VICQGVMLIRCRSHLTKARKESMTLAGSRPTRRRVRIEASDPAPTTGRTGCCIGCGVPAGWSNDAALRVNATCGRLVVGGRGRASGPGVGAGRRGRASGPGVGAGGRVKLSPARRMEPRGRVKIGRRKIGRRKIGRQDRPPRSAAHKGRCCIASCR